MKLPAAGAGTAANMAAIMPCQHPSSSALLRAAHERSELRPTQALFRRANSPTRPIPDSRQISRLGRFDASQLRGFLHGREGSTAKRQTAPAKGTELQWATQLTDKYRLGKVIGTGEPRDIDG